MRRRHAVRIVALRLNLNHDARHLETARFNQHGIAQRHAVFDLARKQLAAFGRHFFSNERRVEAQQVGQLPNQDFSIFHVFQHDIETETRNIIR